MRNYLVITILALGCGGSHSSPQKHSSDAGTKASVAAAPPIAAAQKVCDTVSSCGDAGVKLYVSKSECVKQTSKEFSTGDLSADCFGCLAEVSCDGWQALRKGTISQCDVCSDCCPPPPPCDPGSSSVPGGKNDPCPQNDPVCPSSRYDAVATCAADGTWTKNTAGNIDCKCLARSP